MATPFDMSARINLVGPYNTKPVIDSIQKQLSNIKANVNISLGKTSVAQINNLNRAFTQLNTTLAGVSKHAQSAQTAINGIANTLNSFSTKARGSVAQVNNITKSMNSISRSSRVAATDMEAFGKEAGLAIKRAGAFTIATGAIFGLVRAVSGGVSSAIEFERGIVKLNQVTKISVTGLRGLNDEITRLSTGLGVSSASLLDVAEVLAQAGLSARDVKTALEAVAKASLAPSFNDTSNTVEGLIAIMGQFKDELRGTGIEAKDFEKVLGSINAVSADFAVEADDIVAAIRRTGGVFAAAASGIGKPIDQLNQLIAVFTSVRATTRESAETVATGLRTIFTRLQRPATIDFLRQFGVELTDLDGKFVGPYEGIRRLNSALKDLDARDLRFAQITEELGGIRQVGKLIPAIKQFGEAQRALATAQAGQNSLSEQAALAQQSLGNAIDKTREKFLALIRDITQTSSFQFLARTALAVTDRFIGMADAVKELIPIIGTLFALRAGSGINQFLTGFSGEFKFGKGLKRASGGIVPGQGNSDSVHAMLTPGEYVIRKQAVEAIGVGRLNSINKYASGGLVRRAGGGGILSEEDFIKKHAGLFRSNANVERNIFLPKNKSVLSDYQATFGRQPTSADLVRLKGVAASLGGAANIARSEAEGRKTTGKILNLDGTKLGFGAVFLRPGDQGDQTAISETSPSSLKSAGIGLVRARFPAYYVSPDARKNAESLYDRNIKNAIGQGARIISNDPNFATQNLPDILKRIQIDSLKGVLFEGTLAAYAKLGAGEAGANFDFAGGETKKFKGLFGDGREMPKFLDAKLTNTADARIKIINKALRQFGFGSGGNIPDSLISEGLVKKFAKGGGVDSVHALLTPGEYVINKQSAARLGKRTLDGLNNAHRFNSGGPVRMAAGGPTDSPLLNAIKDDKKRLEFELESLFRVLADSVGSMKDELEREILTIKRQLFPTAKGIPTAKSLGNLQVAKELPNLTIASRLPNLPIARQLKNLHIAREIEAQFFREQAIMKNQTGVTATGATVIRGNKSGQAIPGRALLNNIAFPQQTLSGGANANFIPGYIANKIRQQGGNLDAAAIAGGGVGPFGAQARINLNTAALAASRRDPDFARKQREADDDIKAQRFEDLNRLKREREEERKNRPGVFSRVGAGIGSIKTSINNFDTSLQNRKNALLFGKDIAGDPSRLQDAVDARNSKTQRIQGIGLGLIGAAATLQAFAPAPTSAKSAQIHGGLTGATIGGGVGLQLGSAFGPQGAAIGGAVGGLLGAIEGARSGFSNFEKADALKKMTASIEATSKAFDNLEAGTGTLQDVFKNLKDAGAANSTARAAERTIQSGSITNMAGNLFNSIYTDRINDIISPQVAAQAKFARNFAQTASETQGLADLGSQIAPGLQNQFTKGKIKDFSGLDNTTKAAIAAANSAIKTRVDTEVANSGVTDADERNKLSENLLVKEFENTVVPAYKKEKATIDANIAAQAAMEASLRASVRELDLFSQNLDKAIGIIGRVDVILNRNSLTTDANIDRARGGLGITSGISSINAFADPLNSSRDNLRFAFKQIENTTGRGSTKEFSTSLLESKRLLDFLPEKLNQLAKTNSADVDTKKNQIVSELGKFNIPQAIKDEFVKSIDEAFTSKPGESKTNEQKLQALIANVGELSPILEKQFKVAEEGFNRVRSAQENYTKSLSATTSAFKQIDDALFEARQGIQENFIRIGERDSGKVDVAGRFGLQDAAVNRLAGTTDSGAILRNSLLISEEIKGLNTKISTGRGKTEDIERRDELSHALADNKKALDLLSKNTAKLAAIESRIAEIEGKKAAAGGLATRLTSGGPEEFVKLNRELAAVARFRAGGIGAAVSDKREGESLAGGISLFKELMPELGKELEKKFREEFFDRDPRLKGLFGSGLTKEGKDARATEADLLKSAGAASEALAALAKSELSTNLADLVTAQKELITVLKDAFKLSVPRAGGGLMSGAGTGTSDSIPARLSHGEYVIRADAVKKYGVPFMNALNTGSIEGFARGGRADFIRATRKARRFLRGLDRKEIREFLTGNRDTASRNIVSGGTLGEDREFLAKNLPRQYELLQRKLAFTKDRDLRRKAFKGRRFAEGGFADGGGVSISGQALGVLNNFNSAAARLAQAIDSLRIPENITMTGTHEVNVRVTGAEALAGLGAAVGEMIDAKISEAVRKHIPLQQRVEGIG